ncbi:hypothetical protein P171DRAFT_487442 [Karstenula rhodostoma CBS 690.94]|uniref:Uncharacterized protein n=1 Tax=Karstenula rhodostoma CBS 690.94 TaxID=1392251 RepID=A0A9P4PDN0_9PLEO|nr:hypothetical protein P171DRAFT_487442 [Karstenula rhodostoma CBS 690.94]
MAKLIDACTSERYLQRYKTDSSKSHTSETYSKVGSNGLRRRCFFHEEPSFLEDPHESYRLLLDFVKYLLSDEGEHVTGIVYVLNHEQESENLQGQEQSVGRLTLQSYLEFVRSWIGINCPRSIVLTVNRRPEEIYSSTTHRINSTWGQVLIGQSSNVMGDDPDGVIRTLITSNEHKLHLWNEIYGKEKKQLRKTEIGQLYTKQLEKWIDETKDWRKKMKKEKRDLSEIDRKITQLKGNLKSWKDLQFPPKLKSKR